MNTADLSIIQDSVEGLLAYSFSHLTFEYHCGESVFEGKAHLQIKEYSEPIYTTLRFFPDYTFSICALFGKTELTPQVAQLINALNAKQAADNLTLFLSYRGFLTVRRCGICYDESNAGNIAVDFLCELIRLIDKDEFQQLLALTK